MHKCLLSLLAGTAAAFASSAALAADLPARAAPAAPVAAVPLFTWSGFYAGVNAGYGWRDDDDFSGFDRGTFDVPLFRRGVASYELESPRPFGGGGNGDGFLAGAQVGYNWQVTPGSGFVFGVEADIQGVFGDDDDDGFFGAGGTTFYSVTPTAPATRATGFGVAPSVVGAPGNLALFDNAFHHGSFGNGLDWFGTLRLRAGYAFDRLLIYATGGLAFGGGGDDNHFFGVGTNDVPRSFYVGQGAFNAGSAVVPSGFAGFNNDDDIRWGYALGGGVEWAFTNNLTFKIEGLYVNLDSDNHHAFAGTRVVGVTNTGAAVTRSDLGRFDEDDEDDFFVVRAGLNFKFSTY